MPDVSLEIVEGPGAGTIFPLAGTLEIGSDPGAGIRLEDPHADPQHARIDVDAEGVLLTDLGPRGGTFVNAAELFTSTRISPGDEVQIGLTVLRLRNAGETSATRPAPPPLDVAGADSAGGRAATPASGSPAAGPPPALHVDELLDARTKTKARHAPLAVLVIVVYAVLLYLATTRY